MVTTAAASGPATWIAVGNGSWNIGTNWSRGSVPSGQGVTATVGTGTSTPVTITLDAAQTVGQLTFANSTSNTTGYTLSGRRGGRAGHEQYEQHPGGDLGHRRHARNFRADHLGEQPGRPPVTGTTLAITGSIGQSGGSMQLVLDGAGTLILSGTGDNYTGGTLVEAGKLVVTSNTGLPQGQSLTVGRAACSSSIRRRPGRP